VQPPRGLGAEHPCGGSAADGERLDRQLRARKKPPQRLGPVSEQLRGVRVQELHQRDLREAKR
jgi:hypothetical protein